MRNLIHRWTKLGHFSPKSGHFLQFSRNGKGGVPPSLQLVAYMYRKNVCRVHYLFSYTDFFLSFLLFWCCCSCCYKDFSNDNLDTYYVYKAGKCTETSKSFKIKFAPQSQICIKHVFDRINNLPAMLSTFLISIRHNFWIV